MARHWEDGNDLALVEAIRHHVRNDAEMGHVYTSHLFGTARALGMTEEAIREAFDSDRMLTIYEP